MKSDNFKHLYVQQITTCKHSLVSCIACLVVCAEVGCEVLLQGILARRIVPFAISLNISPGASKPFTTSSKRPIASGLQVHVQLRTSSIADRGSHNL